MRLNPSPARHSARAAVVVGGLALVWLGLVVILLAAKLEPDLVSDLSGYRWIADGIADFDPEEVSGTERAILGLGGAVAFLLLLFVLVKSLPEPQLATEGVALEPSEAGETKISPRVVERVGEYAACDDPRITSAQGRFSDDGLEVRVEASGAPEFAGATEDAFGRIERALRRHGIDGLPVSVLLVGFSSSRRGGLQ